MDIPLKTCPFSAVFRTGKTAVLPMPEVGRKKDADKGGVCSVRTLMIVSIVKKDIKLLILHLDSKEKLC